MKQFNLALSLMAALVSLNAFAATGESWDGRVYDVSRQAFLSAGEVRAGLSGAQIVVLGEKHNTASVQLQEARAVEATLEANPWAAGSWVLGWEFLNRRDQKAIDELWSQFNGGELTTRELMDQLVGPGRESTYIPILEAASRFGGGLRGLNLSRDEKAPVVKGGIGALDPALIPPGFAMGGEGYRERFNAAMGGGHASPDQLDRYFQAQCLVDDVMAYSLLQGEAYLRIEVSGSFHSDYFDAAIARIRARDAVSRLLSIRFVDAADYTEAELIPQLKLSEPVMDPKYGAIADWIWFAGTPASAR